MKMHYFELTFTNHLAHTFLPACLLTTNIKTNQRTGNSNMKFSDSKQVKQKQT